MKVNIDKLDKKQLLELRNEVTNKLYNSIRDDYVTNATIVCHDCGCTDTVKNGKNSQGVQRYKCKRCDKTKVITRNKLHFSSKKEFYQCIMYPIEWTRK